MLSSGAAIFWMDGRAPVEPLRRRGLPMLGAALFYAAGTLCARRWHPPLSLAIATVLLACLALAGLRWASQRTAWFAVLGLWMAVGCWSAQVQVPVDRQRAVHAFADGLSRTVRGRVVSVRSLQGERPVRGAPGSGKDFWQIEPGGWEAETGPEIQSVDLALEAIEQVTPDTSTMVPTSGGMRLTVVGGIVPLGCGDLVVAPVRLREPEIYRDPGAFSYADWLLEQGVGALGTATMNKIRVVRHDPPDLRCRLGRMQHWAASRLEALPAAAPIRRMPRPARLTEEDAEMLSAMLFGDRTRLTAEQRAGFERTGTFHLFVVSGLHVAMVTGALFWMFRRCRMPEIPAVAVTVSLAFLYALFTGFGIPSQRALAMSSLYLIAQALDRQRSGLNALGTAALLILITDPRALYTASFQMTALVIVAVAGLASPTSARLLDNWRSVVRNLETVELDATLHPLIAARRVWLRCWGELCADLFGNWASTLPARVLRGLIVVAETTLLSAAIELCMALPMAVYFHRMVPMALPGNLFVAPLAIFLAGSAAITFVLGLVSPWLAALPAMVTAELLHLVRGVVDALGRARMGDVRIPSPPYVALLFFGVLVVFSITSLRAQRPFLAWSGVAAALALPLAVLWPAPAQVHHNVLEVTALDVGQGDSLLVVSPDGHTMLVDGGGPVGRMASRWDVGEEVVAPFLWSRRLRRLDTIVISHAHSDHIGGLPAVLRDLRPRNLWLSLAPGRSPALRELLAEADRLGVQVRWLAAGDTLPWGGLRATVLAPERSYANYGEARNDDSLVVRLDWGKASVLLEGDAEVPSEAAMVANGRLAPATLLKVGHHGSRTSTTPQFLAAVAPRAAVISVGQHNTFGHPRWEVLQRLEAAHVHTFRTDRFGAETFLLQADGTLTTEAAYN